MKVLKICANEWKNASRDKRELSVVRELGAEAEVLAKGKTSGVVDEVDGYKVTRMSTRPLGNKAPTNLNRVISLFTWASYVHGRNDIDVISGHDITGLLIGWLSNVGKRKKAKLVYDSHEFEIGRAADRNKLQTWGVTHLERFLIHRCAFSIMVNDSIADEVQRIHRLKERPVVARNVPNYWQLDERKSAEVRREMLSTLDLPEDTFLVMYHGAITKNRGIEQLLQAVAKTEGTAAVILGGSLHNIGGGGV